ncbi:dimethylargininase [Solwaraspora sp. WMMB335]|uniref:dimethylargininase n=1 Tax=Solwaraspora sp. WMMB335 TaxID=3404118 RepID=UPI003B93C939
MVSVTQARAATGPSRVYLMCPPEHYTVTYAINPWMNPQVPVDTELAVKQWERLRETLGGLGHQVHLLPARSGLPDMVYAANGAFSVDATVYGARFTHAQRAAEADAHRDFYRELGWRFVQPTETNEGEGDLAYLPAAYGGTILAGYGFRTDPDAHRRVQETLGRPVVSLRLVDPYLYHLDTALAVLDDENVAYYPEAFSPASQRVLRQLFPDALLASRADALEFGLNLVSDGRNVVLSSEATGMAGKLAAAGYQPILVEFSELLKGGGSVKCCVAELRG